MRRHKNLILICICYVISCCTLSASVAAEADWMPDPNLRRAVLKKLGLPDHLPLHPQDMLRLRDLVSINEGIENLQGLQHAMNLNFLHIAPAQVSELTPLAGLRQLKVLKLYENNISDISPLAGLVHLERLELANNQIVDVTPLAGLINLNFLELGGNRIVDITPLAGLIHLEHLELGSNDIEDFSPLAGLSKLKVLGTLYNASIDIPPHSSNLDVFQYDQVCDVPHLPFKEQITNRDYPSVFAAWHNIINMPTLSWEERLTYHDLYHSAPDYFGIHWHTTSEGRKIVGNIEKAKVVRNTMLTKNPNMVFLVGIGYYVADPKEYPDDWPYWLRDASGNRYSVWDGAVYLVDFTQPGAQDIFVQQAIEVAKCGLYDGIFLDWWSEEWNVLSNRVTWESYRTLDAEVDAKVSMLRRIREAVGNDFLILVNTNRSKIPRSAPYVNGTFMETQRDYDRGYTYEGLRQIESTLLWSEQNLREPQINSLEGWGLASESLDSPTNQRWMRVFTTMSLTHSDGYVMYVTGIDGPFHDHTYELWSGHSDEHARGELHDHQHEHYWYDFWDASLGQPIGEKAQLYEGRDGVFIREFDNGWAVYNRSGQAQNIELSEEANGFASGVRNRVHIVPDLDGEIFIKNFASPADVNADGVVNVLDLVAVASGFGENEPDVNADGVVNVLDLVAVANQFGK